MAARAIALRFGRTIPFYQRLSHYAPEQLPYRFSAIIVGWVAVGGVFNCGVGAAGILRVFLAWNNPPKSFAARSGAPQRALRTQHTEFVCRTLRAIEADELVQSRTARAAIGSAWRCACAT